MDAIRTADAGSTEARAFGELESAYLRARDRSADAPLRLRLALGGGSVALEIVGARLFERITPAFAHLVEDEELPDDRDAILSVRLWDADESGIVGPPPAPGSDPTAPAIGSASPDGRFVLQRRSHAVVGHDRARGAVLGWYRDVDALPLYDRGRPLHPQILLWNQDRGAPPLHAGLVARAGRGALFVGAGGSGKTTSTLACLLDGFDFLGDDYIALRTSARGGFAGHAVYGSTHVEPGHLARFPALQAHAVHPHWANEDKAVVFVADVFRERLARRSTIDALFLPTVRAGRTTARPASPAEALLRLVQGAFALAAHAGSRDMRPLFDLASAAPAFWIDLGGDVSEIPAAVTRTLEDLPG